MKILQLKIFLNERPEIWRRFIVRDDITFEKFHEIIQKIMGWENYHLYEFKMNNLKVVSLDEGFLEEGGRDPEETKLNEFIDLKTKQIEYIYDFGDSWEHTILIEEIRDGEIKEIPSLPLCLEGEKACPPEDCGGIYGYEDILEIRKDKNHTEYKERIVEWLGEDFDPEKFDVKEINKELKNEEINFIPTKEQDDWGKEDSENFEEEIFEDEEDNFWEKGGFIQSISSEELEQKKKSIDMDSDEDVNYNCKKCDKKICLHNKDWHNEMCDDCFNKEVYGK